MKLINIIAAGAKHFLGYSNPVSGKDRTPIIFLIIIYVNIIYHLLRQQLKQGQHL